MKQIISRGPGSGVVEVQVQCCVCETIRVNGRWLPADPVKLECGKISHGYCPLCAARLFAEIRNKSQPENIPLAQ